MSLLNRLWVIGLLAIVLAGCDDGDDPIIESNEMAATIRVQVLNLTLAQPLSPIAVILHTAEFVPFVDGEAASAGLTLLAEAGDNSALLDAANASSGVVAAMSGPGAIPPGQSATISIEVTDITGLRATVLGMLVNTNDGFSGINSVDISQLTAGQTRSLNGPAWDAGTEPNDETADTVPGLGGAAAGSSPNTADDVLGVIRFHAGVVTADDGFATSDLNEQHRFDNPVSRILITRTE